MTVEDFSKPGIVYQIGVAPGRIDILTKISGVDFDSAWPRCLTLTLDNVAVTVLGRDDLLMNKRASGRPKDIVDVQTLEEE